MRVIVLADRIGRELLPLTDSTCPALLPVAGKAVLEHALDMLAQAGIKQATVAIGPFADLLRTHFGDGQRWGMALEYWDTRGEEAPSDLLARYLGGSADDPLLVVRGDMLRTPRLAEFLNAADARRGDALYGVFAGQPAGLGLCRAAADLTPLHWPVLAEGVRVPLDSAVDLGEGVAARLESLAAYHRANLDAAAGRIAGLLLHGRQTALGLTQGHNSQISPRSLKVGVAFVGADCRIHATAELHGEVVICDEVIVDRNTRIFDSVVLPHTYIGELVELRKAIVRGNDLIRVDTDAHLHISEAFLIADLRQVSLGHSLSPWLHRLVGLLLLLLSLPLWPLAMLDAWRKPGGSLRSRRWRGNRIELSEFGERRRREFTAWEWASDRPILRGLPRLLAVVSGDLRVVGVEPVSLEQAECRVEEWERLADQAPAGLIGPTQLRIPANAPGDERLMSDAFYASQRDAWKNWAYAWEGVLSIFSRRAWRAEE